MKTKIFIVLVFLLFAYFGYNLGLKSKDNKELRQLTKDKLKLEIELLKIQIEQQEINLQKEY